MAEVSNIVTKKQIKDLATKLRKTNTQWAERLAMQMGWEKQKVYNITNSIVVNNQDRVEFIAEGNKLLSILKQEQIERMNLS